MNKVVFCLGSNVGDRTFNLNRAVLLLEERLGIENVKQSSILENKALLLPNSPTEWDVDFYNIAVSGDINLEIFSPLKILQIIKQIEIDIGRIDRGKWSPREIDIDIIMVDDLTINNKDVLQIPHLGLFERDFFLKTINEIEPELLKKIIG